MNVPPIADPDLRRADFDRRLSIALGVSIRSGLAWEKVAPPGARWLWRRGIRVPPFHLMPFWWTTLALGAAWGVPMSVFFTSQNLLVHGTLNLGLLVITCGAGSLVFGLGMAGLMKWVTRGRSLPRWRDIRADDPDADPGVCVRCGYDFTGSQGARCVECGWTPGA